MEMLRRFIEDAPIGAAMFDRDMRYIAYSARWLLDHRIDAIPLGESHYVVFPEIPDRWREVHRRALAGEVLREAEDRFDRADGSIVWLRWEVRPWRYAEAALGGIIIFTEDITPQKNAEEALQEAESRQRLAQSAGRIGIWDWDVRKGHTWLNEEWCELYGLPKGAVLTYDDFLARVHPADRAAVDKATLDLGYTTIRAPLNGLVGTTQVKAGNLVGRGESTLLTTVSQIDPILFRAGISEADYLRFAKRFVEAGGREGEKVPIDLLLADGTLHPYKGQVDAIERAVDPTTGTLAIQVAFPNPQLVVRPGQYGRARFVSEVKRGALLVPQRAVTELQNLYSLAVVGEGNTVKFRNVKVGPRVENLWVIEEGLQLGETVVVEGLQRLRDGIVVSPKAAAAMPEGSAPQPPTGTR